MSMIEELREVMREVIMDDSVEISIGKVQNKKDIIRLSQTGGGFEKYQTYVTKNRDYEMKFQMLLYINDIYKAYNITENIEQKLTTFEKKVNKYNFSNFKKISGPIDLAFDADSRKVISLNYTCCVENLEI